MPAYRSLSGFGDERLDRKLSQIVGRMVSRGCVCLRQLAEGVRHDIVGFGRFVANARLTVDALIESWGETTSRACEGRHILAIQDTSEINFTTTSNHRRGLVEVAEVDAAPGVTPIFWRLLPPIGSRTRPWHGG